MPRKGFQLFSPRASIVAAVARRFAVAGLAVLVTWVASDAVAVPFRVIPCADVPEVAMRVVAEAVGESEAATQVLSLEPGDLTGTLDLASSIRWQVRVEAPRVWSETKRFTPSGDDPVEVHVWRESSLVGRLSAPRAEKWPDRLTWRLQPAREEGTAQRPRCAVEDLTLVCAVTETERFDCPAPAGLWNVRAKAEGWAALHFWSLQLQPGEKNERGVLQLRRGASVVGEVTTVDGPAHPEATRVELRPIAVAERDSSVRGQRQVLDLRAPINAQGFFLFEDVPPGLYELRAHQPGYSRASVGPIEVRQDSETTVVQPLVLGPPVHLTVQVDPPRPAAGGRWLVQLHPIGETSRKPETSAEGDVDDDGRWVSPAVEPGEYLVRVLDESGDLLAQRGPLELGDGDAPFLAIKLEVIEVAGVVQLGDEGLESEIWFGGQTGEEKVHVVTDEQGRFEAVLPREGEWRVDLRSDRAAVAVRGLLIDVTAGDDDLVIELPQTELAGLVVDPDGAPVPNVLVRSMLVGSGDINGITTDGEGRFVLRGLPAGTYWLEAERRGRTSARHTVVVAEDRPPAPLRLVLEDRFVLAGHVRTEHGPASGAAVLALPIVANGAMAAASEIVTGVDGSFELSLPAGTSETLLVVMPLGAALTVQRVEGRGSVEVVAPPAAGELLVPIPPRGEAGEVGLVLVGGEPIDVHILERWARLHGHGESVNGHLRVPALPSGRYAYCTMSIEEAMLVVTRRAQPTRCSAGYLAAGSDLLLTPPS